MTIRTFNISSSGTTYRTEEYIFIGNSDKYCDQIDALQPANPKSCPTDINKAKVNFDETTNSDRHSPNVDQISKKKRQSCVVTIDYSCLLQQKSVNDLRHKCCTFL